MVQNTSGNYYKSIANLGISQGVSVICGALSLWLLTQVLPKEAMAGYLTMFSIVILLGLLSTIGFDRALMLRLSPQSDLAGPLIGRGLLQWILLVALGVGLCLAVTVFVGVRTMFPGSVIAPWVPVMVVSIPIAAVSFLMRSWFEANHRAHSAHMMPGVTDAARCGLFVVIVATGSASVTSIAWSVAVSTAMPVVVLSLLARRSAVLDAPTHIEVADIPNGLQRVVERIALVGLFQVDLIVMGLIGPSAGAAAEYGIAARLAAIAGLGLGALAAPFGARARRHLAHGRDAAAAQEFEVSRNLGLLVGLAVCVGMTVLGPTVLAVFGDYSASYAPLLTVASSYVMMAAFGPHMSYLVMTGAVTYPMFLRLGALILLLVLLVGTVPTYGATAAAAALWIATASMSLAGVAICMRKTTLRPFDWVAASIGILASAALWMTAFGVLTPLTGGAVLTLLGCIVGMRHLRHPRGAAASAPAAEHVN